MSRVRPAVPIMALLCVAAAPAAAEDEHHGDLSIAGPASLPPSPHWNEPLLPVIDEAAATYSVPRDLLIVLGQLGSAYEDRNGMPTVEGGYGVMALRQNILGGKSLDEAAALLGVDAEQLKVDPVFNIRGAAAVLDYFALQEQVDRTTGIEAWWPTIVRFAGLDAQSSQYFAWQVFSRLESGWSVTNSRGETFAVQARPVDLPLESYAPPGVIHLPDGDAPGQHGGPQPQSPDYPPAAWDPAPSCNYSTQTNNKDTVVIHTAEGSYAGTISWIKNCNSNVSAHYVIAEDGRITQMVRENQYAFHAGCYNARSIGLEHEGFAGSPSHPISLYNASGDLVRDICDAWGIPKQKRTTGPGIIGHVDVTNCCCGTHWDPGPGWDWSYYISRITGSPPPPAYAATFVNHSYPSTMVAGSTAIVWVEFRNDGTGTWTHCTTRLGTSGPRDRMSPFCTPHNWACADGSNAGCNRPTDVDQSSVSTGQIGRFTFILTAPSTPGEYIERFELVREGVTWFGPQITWTINVIGGTGTLTGTVRRAADNSVVVGATVTLGGVGSTTTNGSGVYTFNNVAAGDYTVTVTATGFAPASAGVTVSNGQTTTRDFLLSVTDDEPPSTPTGLTVTGTTASSVSLSWDASSDNIGVAGYDIRRNGASAGTSPTTSFTDMDVSPQTLYTYQVRARDGAGNISDWSEPVVAVTLATQVVVFSDGFNGNLNQWTQGASPFTYSTAQNHGALPGAGAARLAANESDQMYHTFDRPFAQAKVSGWFWDGRGGWKPGVCGNQYRQTLSLRDNISGVGFILDNCMNYANPGFAGGYFWRTIGAGGQNYTHYGDRWPNTDCNGAWIYFESIVTPNAPGASPTGTFQVKSIDGGGQETGTGSLTSDFFNFGIARITLGFGVSSNAEGFWDDIVFEATPPNVPVTGEPVVGTTQIQWTFAAADNNFFGFEVTDGGTPVSPVYPQSGWLTRNATSWTETGLSPNTCYTRQVRAWNGTLNSLLSEARTACTLSVPPDAASITADPPEGCPGQEVVWTAVSGFGPGSVAYYRYVFDQSSAHIFDGSEPVWSSGTLATTPSAAGTWYLHVQGYNEHDVPNGQFAYVLSIPDSDGDLVADCQDGCPDDGTKSEPGVCGCGVSDINQTSIHENGQPVDAPVLPGGTATFSVGASGLNLAYQWHNAAGPLTDNARYAGTSTDTLQIFNVDENDIAAGPYHVVITGECGPPVVSEPAHIVPATPPVITAWRSIRTHAGAGELAIPLDPAAGGNGIGGASVEPREGGIEIIEIDFDQRVVLNDPEAVVISGQTTIGGAAGESVNYSALAAVMLLDDDTLQIVVAPGSLPDMTCYTIKVAGAVENPAGQGLSGSIQCLIRSTAGDVTASGDVTLSDALLIRARIGGDPADAPGLDVNLDGTIDLGDVMAVKARVTSPAAAAICP